MTIADQALAPGSSNGSQDTSSKLLSLLSGALQGLRWSHVFGLLATGCIGKLLWNQYGILRHRHLPERDMGYPILGHMPTILRISMQKWASSELRGRKAVLVNRLFENVIFVSHDLYLQKVHRLELDGALYPSFNPSAKTLLGKNSILSLPGGKGHPKHKMMRNKVLASLGPQQTLRYVPALTNLVRDMLDGMAELTARDGFATFQDVASSLAAKASAIPITAGLKQHVQDRLEVLLDTCVKGAFTAPINLGRFSAFGRAMIARSEVMQIVKQVMASPPQGAQNIIADLMKASEEGEALSAEDIVDTVFTLMLAGKLTTADALPWLMVYLDEHRDWAAKIENEPLDFKSIEEDSATMRFVRETLRLKPPVGAYPRVCSRPLDLGEHGSVPAGCPIGVWFRHELTDIGENFNPDRWTPELHRKFNLVFGGNQPHQCIGKSLALIELQLFARVLCREYEFRVLDKTMYVDQTMPLAPRFKDKMRVSIQRGKASKWWATRGG